MGEEQPKQQPSPEEMQKAFAQASGRRFRAPIKIICERPVGKPIITPQGPRRKMERGMFVVETIGDLAKFDKQWRSGQLVPNPDLGIQLINIFAEFLGLIEPEGGQG